MGRWAEVYFTSPPEKREEAVLDLLRELEAENPPLVGGSAQVALQEEPLSPAPEIRTSVFSETEPVSLAHCRSCGHDNPATHTFCGMCGARLEHDAASTGHLQGENTGVAPVSNIGAGSEVRFSTPNADAGEETQADELSLFRSFSAHPSANDSDHEPPSRPYRLYGAGLAIILMALGYMAWRGGRGQMSHEVPQPPPATAADAGTLSPAPSSSAHATSSNPSKADEQPVAAAKKTKPDPAAATDVPKNPTAVKALEGLAGDNSDAQTATASANGGAELAMAQRYLTGMNGQGRDNAEAAKWLWKSMAKHNAEAALLLADLYLKGDGVSKNCDQARILLDSTARRGMAAAGERLRNLQAFGCQ
ncbi:MAG TPA: hypothetical protein VE377_21355 [Candidatus Dormibacteraeota bacterium]|nr:hypothetical protein [Candidatus Dormibacteraeota bacterium]